MFNLAQVTTILMLQSAANDIAKPDWLDNPPPYLRAASAEAFELWSDHLGYKWWKAQKVDIAQAQMEIIDILHFVASEELVSDSDGGKVQIEKTAQRILPLLNLAPDDAPNDDIESMIMLAEHLSGKFAFREIEYTVFTQLYLSLGMDATSIYQMYVGKNALNNFRAANGYKDGTYIKEWFGKEDNETLFSVLDDFDATAEDYYSNVYGALTEAYSRVLANA